MSKTEKKECIKSIPKSHKTEKIVPGRQKTLHRAIIDTLFANRVARKFWKEGKTFDRELSLGFG